jgi:hypothetical protein
MNHAEARQKLTDAGIVYDRRMYMCDNACDYHTYEQQFVNAQSMALVKRTFGMERLVASTDKHFNDIPLHEWDMLASVNLRAHDYIGMSQIMNYADGNYTPSTSLSDRVCLLKESARRLVQNGGKL